MFYNGGEVRIMRYPCEVVGVFGRGPVRPLRLRYYVVEKAVYHVVEVERVDFTRVQQRGAEQRILYRLQGRRQNLRMSLLLVYEEGAKRWWVIPQEGVLDTA